MRAAYDGARTVSVSLYKTISCFFCCYMNINQINPVFQKISSFPGIFAVSQKIIVLDWVEGNS